MSRRHWKGRPAKYSPGTPPAGGPDRRRLPRPSSPYSRHMAREGTPTTAVRLVAAGAGMVLMLAALPFFVSAGLLAPVWAAVVLDALWLVLFALGLWWFRAHPYRVLALPFVAAALWLAAMTAGEAFLGWTG